MKIIEIMSDARSIVTLVSLLTFLGIVWWAYAGARKAAFAEAADLPFADEDSAMSMEKRHG